MSEERNICCNAHVCKSRCAYHYVRRQEHAHDIRNVRTDHLRERCEARIGVKNHTDLCRVTVDMRQQFADGDPRGIARSES